MIEYHRELITPEKSAEYMLRNDGNRTISRHNYRKIRRAFDRGTFRESPNPIVFDVNGVLRDGQHRLQACIDSGRPFHAWVTTGWPTAVYEVLDGGKSRSIGDNMQIDGHTNAHAWAATVRAIYAIAYRDPMFSPGAEEVSLYTRAHPSIADALAATNKLPQKIRRQWLSAIYVILADYLGEKDVAEAFIGVFRTGIPTFEGDPAHLARERILRGSLRGHTLTMRSYVGLLLCSLEWFRKRQSMKMSKVAEEWVFRGFTKEVFERTLQEHQKAA